MKACDTSGSVVFEDCRSDLVARARLHKPLFEIAESQFEVADQRPIEVILAEHLAAGATIDGYEPAVPSFANPA